MSNGLLLPERPTLTIAYSLKGGVLTPQSPVCVEPRSLECYLKTTMGQLRAIYTRSRRNDKTWIVALEHGSSSIVL